MPNPVLSLRALGRATLARQLLLERVADGISEALTRVGGLQAQEPKPPFLALWNRVAAFKAGDLLAEVRARSVVRVTLHRGTLHMVAARAYPTWRSALAPELAALPLSLGARKTGIDVQATCQTGRELLRGRPMRFAELRPLLAERFPGADAHVLGVTVRLGVPLVLVPDTSAWGWPADSAFGLADEWLPWEDIPLDQAREELVLAHLSAFGPARAADVTAWSGLRGVQSVLDSLGDRLLPFTGEDGKQLYDLPDAPRPPEDVPAPPRLLGEWDTVMLGLVDHTRVVDAEVRARLMTSNGRLRNSFMVDGRVVGAWQLTQTLRTTVLTLEPYVRVPRAGLKAAADEAALLAQWLEPDSDVDVEVAQRP